GPNRYFNTNEVTPSELSQRAIWSPSLSIESPWYPPPGHTITAVPVPRPAGTGYAASVGLSMSSVPCSPGAPPGHNSSPFGGLAGCVCPALNSNTDDRRKRLIGFLRYHHASYRRPSPLRQSSNALLLKPSRGEYPFRVRTNFRSSGETPESIGTGSAE